ncbi:MAG: hypothetical protein E4H09_02480, partial [Spirochaetales bacterium]
MRPVSGTRIVAVLSGNGTISTQEAPIPNLTSGMVQISVEASLVSPGTEIGGWDQLAEQLARKLEPRDPQPFGYSAAGVVAAVGEGVTEFTPGQRVAAVGAGYALHSNVVVVPHHLCVAVPDSVPSSDAAYAMLLATAAHAVRRGSPALGENWLV